MSTSGVLAEQLRRSVGAFVRATRATADVLAESQASTLGFLDREGASSIAQLARWRGIRHQSMRVTVDELERLGFVDRRRDPDDARSFRIRLTADGRQVLADERGRRASFIAEAIDRELEDGEQADLVRLCGLLDRVTARISN